VIGWTLFQIGTLGSIILLAFAFLLCVLSGIAERLEKKRREQAEKAYRRAWRDWADRTNLRKA
jgi:hypothetical protein